MEEEDHDFAHFGILSKPNRNRGFSNSPWTGFLYLAIKALGKTPPDSDKANEWLRLLVLRKHAFLQWVRSLA